MTHHTLYEHGPETPGNRSLACTYCGLTGIRSTHCSRCGQYVNGVVEDVRRQFLQEQATRHAR